jgi:hypothetical protein
MYSTPKPFWDKGLRLDDHGVNAVFVHGGSIHSEMIDRARSEGAKIFAEFATLNGRGYVEKHPEAWPVDERGEKSPPATWFLGACPTEPGFRAYRMKQLNELLDRHDIAGVWMDYFHWHAQFEEPEPILPETCFSPTCIAEFERSAGVRIPEGPTASRARRILERHEQAWRDWRVRHLNGWAEEMRSIVRARKPAALLGVYHCPWTDDEYKGARRRVLGLDLAALARHVDVFSPMVYHGRMGRRPAWVGEYVGWMSKRFRGRTKIWPIVQAAGEGQKQVPAAEFEQVLRGGMSGAASGVMMFTTRAVADDPAKLEVMKRLYTRG